FVRSSVVRPTRLEFFEHIPFDHAFLSTTTLRSATRRLTTSLGGRISNGTIFKPGCFDTGQIAWFMSPAYRSIVRKGFLGLRERTVGDFDPVGQPDRRRSRCAVRHGVLTCRSVTAMCRTTRGIVHSGEP